jgi:5-hydroxyisourate hydrolase
MSGKLTTHILDTVHGCPAAHVLVELWWIDTASIERTLLKTIYTNKDGRTDVPLLADEEFKPGIYQLVFAMGDYFGQKNMQLPDPYFLDRIPIQFGIADSTAHYHVPLLASPWSYSTYRGS